MNHADFLRDRFGGANWVLARRTPNIIRHYGETVICVSKKQYAAVERAYRVQYGDPYDVVRADMYKALLAAKVAIEQSSGGPERLPTLDKINAAIAAEQDA